MIYYKWLAYRKVQVKVIVEAAAKDLIGLYAIDFDDIVDKAFESFSYHVEQVDDEPASRSRKREVARKELQQLEKILRMLKGPSIPFKDENIF